MVEQRPSTLVHVLKLVTSAIFPENRKMYMKKYKNACIIPLTYNAISNILNNNRQQCVINNYAKRIKIYPDTTKLNKNSLIP